MRSSTVDRVLRATRGVDVYVVADPGAVADA